jgi:hypothetical protein
LCSTELHCLMGHQFDPFKFLVYVELAGAEIGPAKWQTEPNSSL